MLIYTEKITPRLQYMAGFVGREITGHPFLLTTDKQQFLLADGEKINYSPQRFTEGEFWVNPHALLFGNNISSQSIECFDTQGFTAFFRASGDFPFDIFAAAFYLLSRYEEYLPHQKDMYGRYAHENSLAYRQGFLDRPLINEWLQAFSGSLKIKFPKLDIRHSRFGFVPTYDIDIAWSFRNKGLRRGAGGFMKSLLSANWQECKDRVAAWKKKKADPFDSYAWLDQLHQQHKLQPHYFFLLADKRGRYDKNISPGKEELRDLVREHARRYPVGIHPSWRSGDEHGLLKREINTLAAITGNRVLSSRQHYIRFNLPDGFRRLIANGIGEDFSMGYGSINGFRASVATPFYWYDLGAEQSTNLQLFPFCYMDANSFYEQKFSAAQALEEMRHYLSVTRSVNGMLVMIWHNHFLGTDRQYRGWKEIYQEFVAQVSKEMDSNETA